jgi:hypothetical protein
VGGAGFIPPLSKGGEAPEVVYLALVEMVQVLRDDHMAMRVEGEEPFGSGLKRFGVWHLGTFLQRVRGICGYVLVCRTQWSGPKAHVLGSLGVLGDAAHS